MTCHELKPRLAALLGGGLTAEEASPAREHLAGCESCSREMRELERVEALLGGWKADPGPVDVWPAVSAKLPRKGWMLKGAAAAVLVSAAGVAVWFAGHGGKTDRVDPVKNGLPLSGAVAAASPENRVVARHVEIAALPGSQPRICYAYIGSYDEALNTRSYDAWSDKAVAAAPVAELSTAGLIVPPAYVPRGSVLKRVDPSIATAEAAWATPFGPLTVLQSTDPTGKPGTETIVGNGREYKLSRFVAGTVEITLVSEGLPWPELDRIRKGFGAH
ncbi:MAG: zf-HC2 domain-containing protein [Planctomycetes bacterium]|nr:zf-HC2 domain-containing protein [Planctomycetota bacterium]